MTPLKLLNIPWQYDIGFSIIASYDLQCHTHKWQNVGHGTIAERLYYCYNMGGRKCERGDGTGGGEVEGGIPTPTKLYLEK